MKVSTLAARAEAAKEPGSGWGRALLPTALLVALTSGCGGDSSPDFVDAGTGLDDAGRADARDSDAAGLDATVDCPPGYAEPDCDRCAEGYVPLDDDTCVLDPCASIECGDFGACGYDAGTGIGACACDDGYAGAGCDECAEAYYPHGGRCVDEIRFALPVANPGGTLIDGNVIGFDNDPEPGTSDLDCVSHDGLAFPHCYDQHTGSDFILVGGFLTMDTGSTAVLAAAAGEVIDAHDGEFDRCQANIFTQEIECPGYPGVTPPNYVKLRHADGKETWYWHLQKDSVLVAAGEWVDCGEPLARVGSSGYSSMPHLHFTVIDADGDRVDPFSGFYSQPNSHWVAQVADYGLPGAACQ